MSYTLPPPQTREFADKVTALAVECRAELEQCSQSLQEIAMLLSQTQSEIDRLAQRETQQAARMRELESSIESFSRGEIRDAYMAAHEVQMRLFMMRSQLDALESRRDSLTSYQDKLRILVNLADASRTAEPNDRTRHIQPMTPDGTRILGQTTVDLGPELIQARERERERISRQLADGPAQVLANLILRTEIVKRAAERAPEMVPAEIEDLRSMAAKSLLDVRRAIFEMRPLVLEELGIVPTMRRYATDFARENGATITINGPERDDKIAAHTRVALFRLMQQALVAMVTPGVGTQVQADIRLEEAQLVVRMDATSAGPKTASTVGRFVEDQYTQEGLELIGGSIQQEPLPTGARITIVVPLGLS